MRRNMSTHSHARVSRYTPTMLPDDQEIAQIRRLSWYALVSCKRKIAKMDMNLPGLGACLP